MATATARTTTSRFERYSWTVFGFFSAVLLLFGFSDLPTAAYSTAQENAMNEVFIGLLSGAIAIFGLRRRQRWAWFALTLWPVWMAAQSLRAASEGNTGEVLTGIFLLVLALAALALSFRPAFWSGG